MLGKQDASAESAGWANGIGLAPAKHDPRRSGRVILRNVRPESLEQACARQCKERITAICDVIREEDCTIPAKTAIKGFGRMNLIAPCTGIIGDGLGSTDRETGHVTVNVPLQDFQSVVRVNLTGAFLTVRECLERMIDHRSKRLICLISFSGSPDTAGQINYGTSKAAVSTITTVITAGLFRKGLVDRYRLSTHTR